ncbi:MAG TPA: porin family protein [Flavisolibacter sp.]|jgi:hypothetical protein|nr:porin family protein [Flavisolibacter sp.]
MKKILFVFSIVAASVAANAQTAFGVKAGANIANLKFSGGGVSESLDSKIGFHAGGFVNIPVSSNFRIQPEALFSMEGAKNKEDNSKVNLSYINIPVMFQYSASGFYGETGPQLGLLMSAKAKEDGEEEDVKDQLETTNLSWAIGAGYKLSNGLGFGARYNLGLSNIGKSEDGEEGKLKSNVIQIGLTYTFGGSAKK